MNHDNCTDDGNAAGGFSPEMYQLVGEVLDRVRERRANGGYTRMGIRVRERRQARNMTQKELADQVGVSQGVIALFESGESSLGKPTAFGDLCRILGFDPGDLLDS